MMEEHGDTYPLIRVPDFRPVQCASCANMVPAAVAFSVVEHGIPHSAAVAHWACSMRCAEDIRLKVRLIQEEKAREIHFTINRHRHKTDKTYLTGAEVRGMAEISTVPIQDYDLWEVEPFGHDRKVADEDIIQMSQGRRFFTTPRIINGSAS